MKTKTPERRETRRSPIKVLVNCLPPGAPLKRNGHETRGWEMWARNIADDGVCLQWSRDWATKRCPHCFGALAGRLREGEKARCQCESPSERLKQGQEVQLEGLVYGDEGSELMRGRIQWVRGAPKGDKFEIGVYITSPDHRDYFKALE